MYQSFLSILVHIIFSTIGSTDFDFFENSVSRFRSFSISHRLEVLAPINLKPSYFASMENTVRTICDQIPDLTSLRTCINPQSGPKIEISKNFGKISKSQKIFFSIPCTTGDPVGRRPTGSPLGGPQGPAGPLEVAQHKLCRGAR